MDVPETCADCPTTALRARSHKPRSPVPPSMAFTDETCTFCGRPAHLHAGGEGHGLVALSDDEAVGRVCETCAEEKLDGVPDTVERSSTSNQKSGISDDTEECVVCGAAADYAHVGLTVERTAEGNVPIVEREGEETPILCETHFKGLRE